MTGKPTIEVLYTCKGCGLVKARLSVAARGDEDVVAWLEGIKQTIADDHLRRSPMCLSRTCDLMVPIEGTDRVGGPVVN